MSCASWDNLFEDKKCRICGLADMSNVNIFTDKTLQMKISTVYPIIFFQDDPLPRNICRKCISTVSSNYNDIQKVIKLQNKWTENVRVNEPNNSFLQALDILENATEAIKNFMFATIGTVISTDTINRQITMALSEIKNNKSSYGIEEKEILPLNGDNCEIQPIKKEPINQDEDEEEDLALSKIAASKNAASSASPPTVVMCRYCPLQFESLARLSLHQNIHLSLRIPKLFQTKFLNKKSRRGRLITINNRQSIRCLNCWRIFEDNKCILEHWSKGECEFYCQICGEEFEQSPKMLREHVVVTHGVSYKSLKMQRDRIAKKTPSPSKPKPRIDFTVKNLKEKKDFSALSLIQVQHAKTNFEISNYITKPPPRHPDKLVICRICSRTFQNFKACNSHMRAHKPPYAYGETAPLPDVDADAYTEFEYSKVEKNTIPTAIPPQNQIIETESYKILANATSTEPMSSNATLHINVPELPKKHQLDLNSDYQCSTSPNTSTSQSATKMPTSTAPRGIRMKFVSRRSDLNGSGPSIKVKSLSDLQGAKQNVIVPHHSPIVNEVQNVLPTTSPEIPLNTPFFSPKIKDEPLDNLLS